MIIRRSEPIAVRYLSDHFRANEFFCHCNVCMDQIINIELVYKLEKLRAGLGKPLVINSGYRCTRWNGIQKGAPDSQHLLGRAADVYSLGSSPVDLAYVAYRLGFTGIGVGEKFTHLDVRNLPLGEGVKVWTYDSIDVRSVRDKILKGV